MRTIDFILTYSFTPQELYKLEQNGIINGCGGEGKNIEKPLRAIIELLPGYNDEKAEQLFKDIQKICYEHDYEFHWKMGFYRSNYRMAKKVFLLLHWAGWKRFGVAATLFILLCKYGKPFYS